MTVSSLKKKINRYFADCADSGTPATPAGLALALDMRTAALVNAPLPPDQRRLIDQALQRIEASTMELALSKAAAKGVEVVLQHTDAPASDAALQTLSDEELDSRLDRLARRLEDGGWRGEQNSEHNSEQETERICE